VSKAPRDIANWRSGSESLFRAARADHEASAADYARVQAELARRIAAGAPAKLALDGDELATATKLARAFTPGTIVKLFIGLSLLAAGSLAILRTIDSAQSRASRPDPVPSLAPAPPPSAAPADRPLEPSVEEPPTALVPESGDTPLLRARARHEGTVRVTQSRPAPKRPIASRGASVNSDSNFADEPVSPTPASVSTRASAGSSSKEANAQPASRNSPSLKQPEPKTPAAPPLQPVAAATLERLPTTAGASARTSPPPQTHPVRVEQSVDARAELGLVERMHAAMRAAEPAEALALCAEHAKRWPRGVFTEEREAVRAIASCALRSGDAAARAELFLSKHPRAPTAPRVAAACAPLSAAMVHPSSK
jgi:hypothetical protein